MSALEPAQLQAALAVIRASPHRYVGIRPLNSTPLETPCFVLPSGDRTIHGLMYQLDSATQYWPEAQAWEIVASDLALNQPAGLPPGAIILRQPTVIAQLGGKNPAQKP